MALNPPPFGSILEAFVKTKAQPYLNFMNQLEGMLPGTKDGKVNKEELQQGYDALLAQAADQIPQEIKNRFKNGQAMADQFERMDALGYKETLNDGYVDAGELASEVLTATENPPKPEGSSAEASDAATENPPKPKGSPAEASDTATENPPKPEGSSAEASDVATENPPKPEGSSADG